MFCTKCGAQNADYQTNCSNCGAQLISYSQPERPPNYLVWSIISTILCCLPAGIAAIVYSARVDSKYNAGDYAGAIEASNTARKWNIGALIAGAIINFIYLVGIILGSSGG